MNIQEAFTNWYVAKGNSLNSVNTYKTAMRKTRLKNGTKLFDIEYPDEIVPKIKEKGLESYFQDRDGDYSKMDALFDYDEGIQKDDLKGAIKSYIEFLEENSPPDRGGREENLTDLKNFKMMLEYFLHILRVNKGLEESVGDEAKSGAGYKEARIRNSYAAFRDFSNGMTMDVTIQAGYTIDTKGCYIHWTGTSCNVVAVWNEEYTDINGMQLYEYGKDGQDYPSYTIGELGLNDENNPNENIRAFFNSYKRMLEARLASKRSADGNATWIFQGNPKYYDVIGAVESQNEIVWAVNQSPKRIKGGDKVYIWLSGRDGGIIASGTILSDPALKSPMSNDPFNRGEALKSEPYLGVDIQIDVRCTDKIIERSVLLADERTKKLEILLYPGATNFAVTKEQDDVIESILGGTYVRVPAVDTPPEMRKRRYWLYSPGEQARLWDEFNADRIMGIGWDGLGSLNQFKTREEIKNALQEEYDSEKLYKNDSLAIWQFVNEIVVGDIVFVKQGLKYIIGRGTVESEYIYDDTRDEYKNIRKMKWDHTGKWEHTKSQLAIKTLTDITQYTDFVEGLEALVLGENVVDLQDDEPEIFYPDYSKYDFLEDVFFSAERYDVLCGLLVRKKNVILQGAPGVGKTYAAKRLAYSMMGTKDTSRVKTVQFHQSYSYEDFIMGYRPDEEGFRLVDGVFYRFCKEAETDDDRPYFFIIDEINRGNLSKIFGELLMLVESDKRGEENSLRLLYKDEQFFVPANVHIIGMMNTADRSLAMIDYALRRRFAFFDIEPGFSSNGFIARQTAIDNPKYDALITTVKLLNNVIAEDASLGAGFRIGHSYFCLPDTQDALDMVDDAWLSSIIDYEIAPLLQEYWFDEPSKVDNWTNQLRMAING